MIFKKTITVLLVVMFVTSLTAAIVSADDAGPIDDGKPHTNFPPDSFPPVEITPSHDSVNTNFPPGSFPPVETTPTHPPVEPIPTHDSGSATD
jgi:hypothetical protein